MRRRNAERGEGNLGCIVWLLVLGLAVMICVKAVPVKIASAEMYDYMDEVARTAGVNTTAEEVKKAILARAVDLKLPVHKDQVTVVREGDRLRMRAEYTVPVEFPGYTYNWHFVHELDRPIFVV
jgi:predicted lipid carrier protein YhbT